MAKWLDQLSVERGDVIVLPNGRIGTVTATRDENEGFYLLGVYGAHFDHADEDLLASSELLQNFDLEQWDTGPLKGSSILVLFEGPNHPVVAPENR